MIIINTTIAFKCYSYYYYYCHYDHDLVLNLCFPSEDSFFGTRLRQELLRGLLFGAAALTVLVLVVLTAVVLLTDLPVTVIVLIYLALVIVPWPLKAPE